jgi:hypothetical protein
MGCACLGFLLDFITTTSNKLDETTAIVEFEKGKMMMKRKTNHILFVLEFSAQPLAEEQRGGFSLRSLLLTLAFFT